MKADYVTYQKATSRSLIGVVIHAVLAVAFLMYGVRAGDHSAVTAAWFVGLGILVWAGLAIVHDQHRRERIEALEHESLSADQGGSVFEGAGDFRVAGRRLEFVERWLLPSLSLAFGTLLILVGVWRFMSGRYHLEPGSFMPPMARGWGLAIWIIAAFVGFPFARYIAAMSKQTAWAKLRAGAGQSVAIALMGLLSVVAHFIDVWGPDGFLRSLQVVFPIAMVVLGAEVYVNFLLDLYRPRKAGEVRPIAADSKLMSFAAAPDRIAESVSEAINYQFGYNVSSTWLYQLLSRSVANLAAAGLLVGWLLSSAAVIQPHQQGLVLRFGEFSRAIGPGIHLKLPWPMETVAIPSYYERDERGLVVQKGETTTGVRTLQLGTLPPGRERMEPVLWTNEHAVGEVFFIVRPSPVQLSGMEGRGSDSAWLSDLALVATEIPVQYAVKDVNAFESLGDPEQREALLKAVAQRAAMRTLKGYSVDDLLGPRRTEAAPKLRAAISEAFERLNPRAGGKPLGAGVEVLGVSVQGVHPAKTVAPAYEKVVQAQQGAEGLLESSNATAISTLIRTTGSRELAKDLVAAIELRDKLSAAGAPAAERAANEEQIASLLARCEGSVAEMLAEASASRWEKHLGMRERAKRYAGQVASFEANEPLFRAQLYYAALIDAVRETRLYITDDSKTFRADVDLTDRASEGGFTELNSDSQTK